MDDILAPWRKFINERPPLLSLLYDIDMLPEQCVTNVGAVRLSALCDVWRAWESGEKCPTWKEPEPNPTL